jgi:hypothetical protein
MTASESLDSEYNLGTEIQREKVGQQADVGKLSNDFSSIKISVPKVLREMKSFYYPNEDA